MNKLKRALTFLRLTDNKNNLSLTNIWIMIAMYKMLTTNATSMNDLGLFVLPLLSYLHKRHTGSAE